MISLKNRELELNLSKATVIYFLIYFLIFWVFIVNPLVWFYESHTFYGDGVGYTSLIYLFPSLSKDFYFWSLRDTNLNSDFLLTNINLGIGLIALIFTRFMTKRGKG